jgi:hypothetical protein
MASNIATRLSSFLVVHEADDDEGHANEECQEREGRINVRTPTSALPKVAEVLL